MEDKNRTPTELQGLQDSLTRMVVHDLKNPLTGIMGCCELLLMMPESLSDKQISIVKKIDESATVILKMITDILDISRLEENKFPIRKQTFHMSEILESNVNDFAVIMQQHHVTSSTEIQENMPRVEADKDMIRRVIANLMQNAIKHSLRGGNIRLSAGYDSKDSRLNITVKDNGEGIAPEHADKIFEKFAQAELKQLGLKTDRGLGLTFCKLAVEAHGGRIWVESKTGEGSEFKFYIPSPAL